MQSGELVVLGYAKPRRGAGLASRQTGVGRAGEPPELELGLRMRLGPVGSEPG